MRRLIDKIYVQILHEVDLDLPADACLIGSFKSFTDLPEIDVVYLLKSATGEMIGGRATVQVKSRVFRGYAIRFLRNFRSKVFLSRDELDRFGLISGPSGFPVVKSRKIMDESQTWLFHDFRGERNIFENIEPEFERLLERALGHSDEDFSRC